MKNDAAIWEIIAKQFSNEISEEETKILIETLKKRPELKQQFEIISILRQLPVMEDRHNVSGIYHRISSKISSAD